MACGKVALTSVLGFEETMKQEASFLLFQASDPKDLASKLAKLLTLPTERVRSMGDYLQRQTLQNHSLNHLAVNLTTLLHELTE